MLMVSSVEISLDDLLSMRSLDGIGGGDDPCPGGVADLRDLLELRREGVRYGVSCGVGREAAAVGPLYSSSVSHMAMLKAKAAAG
jgi:hypothetical protein